jgi:hypothetical protein
MTDKKELEKRYRINEKELEDIQKQQLMSRIYNMGEAFWKGVYKWGQETNKLTVYQCDMADNIFKAIRNKRILRDHEIEYGFKILEKVEQTELEISFFKEIGGFKGEESEVDNFEIFQRIKSINDQDWERIILLGSQTKKLDDKEIGVIRTTKDYLKHGKSLTPKMLQIVHDALNKMRKFGLKV